MALKGPPKITDRISSKTVSFMYRGNRYEITYEINENMIRFGELYPQTEMPVYFTSPVSEETKQTLLSGLRSVTSGMEEREAVDFLLRFVQTGFDYKTDGDQFGKEKPMFVEETLFYPYSDCEDRSVLFAYLVRELVGLEVVGLEYPGHIATAVRFSLFVPGDGIRIDGERFVICDPTYVNAVAGMSMPMYRGKSAKPIRIEQ
jgi:hypothetical protein